MAEILELSKYFQFLIFLKIILIFWGEYSIMNERNYCMFYQMFHFLFLLQLRHRWRESLNFSRYSLVHLIYLLSYKYKYCSNIEMNMNEILVLYPIYCRSKTQHEKKTNQQQLQIERVSIY